MMVMVMEMMTMMIPMNPSSITVTVATMSPLREEISPENFSLSESFSLYVVFRPVEVAEYFLDDSSVLGFPGDEVHEGGLLVVARGHHTMWRRGLGSGRATMWWGPMVAHLWPPFWLPPSSGELGTL